MVLPDVEQVHGEKYRFYYHGHIFELDHVASGWVLSHPKHPALVNHVHESVEVAKEWLSTVLA